jgi:PKD repeat protein
VAPLYVFFDATTAEVMQPPEVDGRREYADLKYEWDFGDPDSGSWGTSSGLSKNRESAYLAAHVYEKPGTYTVKLTVTSIAGATAQYSTAIMVDDPEVIYAGQATTCVSTGSNFEGCPTGALQVTSNDFAGLKQYLGDGKRILLRRGDAWKAAGSGITLTDQNGPFTISAFGACSNPDRLGICENAPKIEMSADPGDDLPAVFRLHYSMDVRITDLTLQGDQNTAAISGTTEMHRILALRLRTRGFRAALGNSTWDTKDFEELALVSCDAAGTLLYVVYLGGMRMAVIGGDFRDSSETHVLRLWQAHRTVIAHNEMSGSSLNTADGRHALKLHGPSQEALARTDGGRLEHPTRHVVVADNIFGSSGPWPVAVGPQDALKDERLEDILLERNRFYPQFGNHSSREVGIALHIWARNVTVRNNLFLAPGYGYSAVTVEPRGIEPPPSNVRLLNNTVYVPVTPGGSSNETIIFRISPSTSRTLVRNTLAELSGGTRLDALIGGGATDLVEDHNLLTADARFVHPEDADVLLRDFSVAADSPAVDVGAEVPLFDDLLGTARPRGAGYDIGAFER